MAPPVLPGLATGPDTVAGWKAIADGMLSDPCCAFHRNLEISARYAWLYSVQPICFKWAAMAAVASHHVRRLLFPLRLDADRSGFVDIPRSLHRRRLPMADVNTIRSTNNAIFDDIFWVHLAYGTADDPLGRVQALLRDEPSYARILAGFETIDVGRRALEEPGAAPAARRAAENAIWEGNVELLRHEQQALVQPNFDRLSCSFARLISLGAATSFEVRGVRHEIAYFTSFFGYSLTRGAASALRDRSWPRITRYEDRWNWLVMSVVPRFRRFDAMAGLMQTSLRRIGDEASAYAALPCVPPLTPARMG